MTVPSKSPSNKRWWTLGKQIARIVVVVLCLGGFLFQTTEFLMLYWTYPTVVDIQKSSPSYLEIPAITICNPVGYNYTAMCTEFGVGVCMIEELVRFNLVAMCNQHPDSCLEGNIAPDYIAITYIKFLRDLPYLSYNMHDKLRETLEHYMNCTITYAGQEKPCNMEYVMGSFFTKDDMPQYCYTLYSLWGAPNKKRERIPKGSIMKFHFNLNATKRSSEITVAGHTAWFPKFSLPTTPSVQIGVHTPYFLPSPYVMGSGYQGGKAYELRVLMEETHLLPSPYQTNCTDYLKEWRERGGKGPVNQLGVVQECRVKKYSELWGCVPLNVDYPHTENICGTNIKKNVTVPVQDCMLLADSYNQPCDSLSYETDKEEVDITLIHFVQSRFLPSVEEVRTKIQGHDCAKEKMWKPECSVIDIEILFDRFEITNLTYNPKFESLELFSVIGGYMGMWLGISLVAVYDFMATALGWAQRWTVTKRRKRIKSNKKDSIHVAGAPRKVWNEQKLRNGYYDW